MKNIFISIFFTLLSSFCCSQSIHRSWYLEPSEICFTLDSANKCIVLSGFYTPECALMKYKIKDNVLRLKFKSSQYLYGWSKEFYYYKIVELTDSTLILYIPPPPKKR